MAQSLPPGRTVLVTLSWRVEGTGTLALPPL